MITALLVEEAGGPVGTERLLNFGVLGVMVLLFVTGWLVTGRQYRKLEARNEELQKYATDFVVPLLERTTRALENNTEVMRMLIKPPTEAPARGLPLASDDPEHPS